MNTVHPVPRVQVQAKSVNAPNKLNLTGAVTLLQIHSVFSHWEPIHHHAHFAH
ncbi:hypothetical protein K493DRAFT_9390 [Basidiobolus meristosporus CBS 931.73]|uniref:Uncharacterized protein n=1 Tax=Basidiobolus meristosporus CBS 931.73 TaxID=1314790 RepID=A0A1Y1ZA37_9FUNG|nr:hypothetical protein K493DRAFT_9390 [Basidiobolus meristosporus CBS 931.73]|eukprot:ORY06974.1 hypothetical protein K493DRAFT_9390 [Basidiobolus meristosporus CBS 931.73]